jgi:hypothetical protein
MIKPVTVYHFRLVVQGALSGAITEEELLDATDRLGDVGCDDAAISPRGGELELEFDRTFPSLQEAIVSAVRDVERAGFRVRCVEMDRDDALHVAS